MGQELPVLELIPGAELPDAGLIWRDNSGAIINFASGYTFTLKIATPTTFTKSSGITGAATAPNIVISWTAGELDSLAVGLLWQAQLWARQTATTKDRVMPLSVVVSPAIT